MVSLVQYTHCPTCQADLRLPRAAMNLTRNGQYGSCRACRNEAQRLRGQHRYTSCAECGKEYEEGRSSVVCGRKCHEIRRERAKSNARSRDVFDSKTLRILTLVDSLWRCSTHWERAEVQGKIDMLKRAQ